MLTVFADKTNNLYHVDPEYYKKLVRDSVTTSYKVAEKETLKKINDEAYTIITKNKIPGKIPKYEVSDAFVTVKDHKKDFPRTVKCRLLNSSKTHIGKLSKKLLQQIISKSGKRPKSHNGRTRPK